MEKVTKEKGKTKCAAGIYAFVGGWDKISAVIQFTTTAFVSSDQGASEHSKPALEGGVIKQHEQTPCQNLKLGFLVFSRLSLNFLRLSECFGKLTLSVSGILRMRHIGIWSVTLTTLLRNLVIAGTCKTLSQHVADTLETGKT